MNVLAAEKEHLISVSISLPNDIRHTLIQQLTESFTSDGYNDLAKAWNEERVQVIEEAIEKHLLPMGIKWVREYVREEVEDYLAKICEEAFFEVLL